jgi:hypothetical protein
MSALETALSNANAGSSAQVREPWLAGASERAL